MALATDVGLRADEINKAMSECWQSDANWDANASVMRRDLGKFAFDTTLMTASGLAGGRLGASLRPFNSPFHEHFIRSRSNAHLVTKEVDGIKATSIAWDLNRTTGWHKPIYTPQEVRALAAETGLELSAIQRVSTMPTDNLNALATAGRRAGPESQASKLGELAHITETLRVHGSLGNYYGPVYGLYGPTKINFATRNVPRFQN